MSSDPSRAFSPVPSSYCLLIVKPWNLNQDNNTKWRLETIERLVMLKMGEEEEDEQEPEEWRDHQQGNLQSTTVYNGLAAPHCL